MMRCLQEGRMLEAHDTDAEIDQMHELFSSIFCEEYPPEDLSAAEWLKQKVRAPATHPYLLLSMYVSASAQFGWIPDYSCLITPGSYGQDVGCS